MSNNMKLVPNRIAPKQQVEKKGRAHQKKEINKEKSVSKEKSVKAKESLKDQFVCDLIIFNVPVVFKFCFPVFVFCFTNLIRNFPFIIACGNFI